MHAHHIRDLHTGRITPRMRLLAAALAGGALLTSGAALADGNDNCPGAPIAALPFNDTGVTTGGNNTIASHQTSACTNYAAVQGPDKIYRLEVVAAGSLTITVTPQAGFDTSIYLLNEAVFACPAGTGAVAPAASCVGGADDVLAGQAETITLANIPVGTYNLFVDSFYSSGALSNGTFTLAITGTAVLGSGTQSADLSITKTDGTLTSTPGTSTTYTITVTNDGPGDVSDAEITDTFPAACTSVSYTAVGSPGASGFTVSGTGNIADTAVELPSGASVTYTAVCAINPSATGDLVNTATVSSADANDPNTSNNNAIDRNALVPVTGLSITKTDGATSVVAGSSTTYTIVASNAGPSVANAVSVIDNFPAACTSVSYTATGAGGATGFTASGAGNINDAAVNLPAGGSVTYTATCGLAANATGTLSNTATLSGSGSTLEASDTTTIQPRATAPVVTTVPTLGGFALGLLGLMLGLLGFTAFRRQP